jgi:aminomethyltransferase
MFFIQYAKPSDLAPRDFGNPEKNFWNLIEKAIICDVAVERQVEITGPDAYKFIQLLTPRDLSKLSVGQCKYVLITNIEGGILNDPVLLRLAENHFWLSLADSDVLLWAQGVAVNSSLDVQIKEPDVSPLQLQGPTSGEIMIKLFGPDIKNLKYYWLREYNLDGIPLIVSRTGWSSELGYEIYLRDGSKGNELYEKIMAAGKEYGLQPGHTSSIRRIEGGMLSYHADADINTNPFELGLDRLVSLDNEINFIGKDALKKIKQSGVTRKQVGIEIYCEPLKGPNTKFWKTVKNDKEIGKVTSAVYSPRLKKNIALAMIDINFTDIGNELKVNTNAGIFDCKIVEKPFYDPKKKIVST